LPGPLTQRRP